MPTGEDSEVGPAARCEISPGELRDVTRQVSAIDGTVRQLAQEVAAMRGEMKGVNTSLRTIVDCGLEQIFQRSISRFGAIEDQAADKLSSAQRSSSSATSRPVRRATSCSTGVLSAL